MFCKSSELCEKRSIQYIDTAFVRNLAVWALKTLFHDRIFANVIGLAKEKSVGEYIKLTADRDAFIRSFTERVRAIKANKND